jgi:hypothetical protein
MKSFSQFVLEAPDAKIQARMLGLQSDGHGGWYTRKGEFTAKTKTDPRTRRPKLVFYNKGTKLGQQDRRQTERERRLSFTSYAPVASSYDYGTNEYEHELREKYINKQIFAVDDWVRCPINEKEGKIIRRGTNYLICVTEDGEMFKPWIKDVYENIVNGTTKSGVPADQRLVGTDSNRKYAETMVPGSSWGKQFINKYKKK